MTASDWTRRLPWGLVLVAAALVVLGLLGIARSEELAGSRGHHSRLQLLWASLALTVMLAATVPNYRLLIRYSYLLYAAALALLVIVFFFPAVHGTHRWIRFGPLSLQPSELSKLALVLALARWMMYRENFRRLTGMLAPLGLATAPMLLILREPDLGTALVFLPVTVAMLFAAGARSRDLLGLVACGVILLPLLWSQMSREQRSRVTALFEQGDPWQAPNDDGYQLHQAKQLMALGGVWGSLLAGEPVEDPSAYHLPEDHTDFIFSVLCERFGWTGAAAVLALFVLLAQRGLSIAADTREPFGRLVAVGLVSLFASQSLINTGMTVGLLPITGLSLPLVSYGGSGMLAHALALGLLLNVGLRPGYEVAAEPFRFRKAIAG